MRYFFGLLLALLVTSCSVKTTIEVNADPNGSGAVIVKLNMDPEAAAVAGNLEDLRGTDLVNAGWEFSENTAENGAKTLAASRSFSSTDEANALMAQLTSEGGALSDFILTQESSGLSTKSTFSGSVDLTQGLSSFGDLELLERTGSRLGFDANEFFTEYDTNAAEAFPVVLKVSLPGSPQVESPEMVDGTWPLAYGEVTTLELESKGIEWKIIVYGLLGLVLIAAAAGTFVLWKVETEEYVPRHVR